MLGASGWLGGIFADEAPGPPPATELPLPAGYEIRNDEPCSGSRLLDPPAG
jgi:hypothetical protein